MGSAVDERGGRGQYIVLKANCEYNNNNNNKIMYNRLYCSYELI